MKIAEAASDFATGAATHWQRAPQGQHMKALFFVGFALLVLAGCSGSDEVLTTTTTPEPTRITQPTPQDGDGVLDIAELLATGGEREVAVRGFVVWDDSSARFCEVLAESFPPQCGGISVILANPDALDVALETEGAVRWTQGFVTIEGFYDGEQLVINENLDELGPNGTDDIDGDLSLEDQALADAFLGFVADPSFQRFDQLNLADNVGLGLGDEIAKTVPAEVLLDPTNWTIVRDEFRAWSGPFSALWLAEPPITITIGDHLRCVAEPVPAPPGFADHRRVSLQPEGATSCLEWWTVDFFLDSTGQIEAVTIDLFAP